MPDDTDWPEGCRCTLAANDRSLHGCPIHSRRCVCGCLYSEHRVQCGQCVPHGCDAPRQTGEVAQVVADDTSPCACDACVAERLREAVAEGIYAGGDEAEWLTTVNGSPNAASYDLADRALAALPIGDLAVAAVQMANAHKAKPTGVGRASITRCSGTSDPLTAHFCLFRGTAQEQHDHLIERVTVALRNLVNWPGNPTPSTPEEGTR